jgi:hypothetical protein
MDQAVHAYVASYLAGRDVLLMAADWARCRELSARIRDDLIHLGLVDDGPAVRIADGAEASAGDLIICRRNDHRTEAGEPGRSLGVPPQVAAVMSLPGTSSAGWIGPGCSASPMRCGVSGC